MITLPVFEHPPIDIHSHFNHGSPFDCPEVVSFSIHNRELDFVKAGYDHIGICAAGMSTFASVMGVNNDCIPEENEYLHELAAATDWMYQWVVLDPRIPQTYRQAERMLGHKKVLGLKIHPTYHKYDIVNYADELFGFANDHNAIMLMHPDCIAQMPAFADKYPDMKLIIAHLGSVEHVDAIANARHGNIYTDTSGGASNMNNVLEYAVGRVGSEKILFGTDTYSCAFQFGRVALSALSQEDKENILYKNAIRLFSNAFGA